MGIDATITARGDLTIDQNSPWFDGDIKTSEGIAYFDTNERYYGPSYPRGDWPTIYAQIRKLQSVFPRATVHYGSDHDEHDDPGEVCTGEYLEEIWQYYLTLPTGGREISTRTEPVGRCGSLPAAVGKAPALRSQGVGCHRSPVQAASGPALVRRRGGLPSRGITGVPGGTQRGARYAPGMSAVIYARVPDSIKDGVDAYAEHWGLTIARAVADLLDIGLGGTPRQPVHARLAELEERVAALERKA